MIRRWTFDDEKIMREDPDGGWVSWMDVCDWSKRVSADYEAACQTARREAVDGCQEHIDMLRAKEKSLELQVLRLRQEVLALREKLGPVEVELPDASPAGLLKMHQGGKSVEQIAEAVGQTPGWVRLRLRRASATHELREAGFVDGWVSSLTANLMRQTRLGRGMHCASKWRELVVSGEFGRQRQAGPKAECEIMDYLNSVEAEHLVKLAPR